MLRWRCNNCNITLIYPVNRCSHCKGDIIKERTKKMKVIGITKVAIPSPMHPIVPYNVLLLEDEHGNRMPRKTMKDYTIGDEFSEQAAKGENAVSIVKVKYDVYDAVEHALELINFNVKKDFKILIKPSIIFPAYAYQAVNTNPKTADAVIKFLLARKISPQNITVAEQAAYGIDTGAAAAKAGILKVCQENKVNVVDIAKTEFEEKEIKNYKFRISREILNKDLIINIPILKTHSQWNVAGALENMARVTDIETQKEMHRSHADERLAYLSKLLKYVTVGDATIGMHGNGPLVSGEPAFLNLVLASKDPVALDRVFCEIGFFDVPDYIKIAGSASVGKVDLKEIEVVGNEIDAVKYPLQPANKNPSPHSGISVVDGKAWIGDYIAMYELLGRFASVKVKEVCMVIGSIFQKKDLEGKENVIAFGDNAIKHMEEIGIKPAVKIRGNPPDSAESIIILKNIFGDKVKQE